MTEDEVQALPVIVDLPTAARVLGLGWNTAYELVRSGNWPTPVLRFGRLIKVRRSSLIDLLGLESRTASSAQIAALSPPFDRLTTRSRRVASLRVV